MAHAHDHDHSHPDNDTYYLDQLCLIGICAAFAGICLALYFSDSVMLRRMLNVQFDPFVLFSGVALLALVVVRSVTLWREAGARARAHEHAHTHDHPHHHHDHEHEHCSDPHHAHGHEH